MDLLFFNKLHWYDTTTQKRRDEVDAQFPGRYVKRHIPGDIIQVEEDGYFRIHGYDKSSFGLLEIPGLKCDISLQAPLWDGTVKIKSRRYTVNIPSLSLDVNAKATIVELADAHIADKSGVSDIGNN